MRQWFTKSVIHPLARELIDPFNFKTRGLEIDKYQEYFKWIRNGFEGKVHASHYKGEKEDYLKARFPPWPSLSTLNTFPIFQR